MAEAITFAESAGWIFYRRAQAAPLDARRSGPDVSLASKDLVTGEGQLSISVQPDPGFADDGGHLVLSIILEHDS